MKYQFIISGFLGFISCNNGNNDQVKNSSNKGLDNLSQINSFKESAIPSENFSANNIPDSNSLDIFWKRFQDAVKKDNQEEVIKRLKFPIHAIHIVTFQFSYDCDTNKFIKNETEYI